MKERDALREWRSIVGLLRRLARLRDLDVKAGPFTVREVIHHVVEANVVAASILVAALGSPGCTYDWSWMMPFGPWMTRMRYDLKPVTPTMRLLAALNAWVAVQVGQIPDGLTRTVRLRDRPGGRTRRVTVAAVLLQEADHAREEVEGALAALRSARRRGGSTET